MKTQKQSDGCWKTDPRAAYIPGAVLVSLILLLCLTVGPAWSFETFDGVQDQTVFDDSKQALTTSYPSQPSSPTMVDSCLPLLKSIHHTSPVPAMDRNQRSAGKAAAAGLIQGVRFALSPPQKAKSHADRPRSDVWQISGVLAGDRSALTVTAYRQCQKEQALKVISEFRWAR
ncbi:MAG: hypothetical protein KDI11_03095 [Alphaproteobacteria bacterium]|nr:hypothetical protein [Alphaproteobacteria bacterium]